MNHFKKWKLPSHKSTYVKYTSTNWENQAKKESITCAELKRWLDKAYARIVEKKYFDNHNKNINKTSDPKDCPDMVKSMWNVHIYATKEAMVVADI